MGAAQGDRRHGLDREELLMKLGAARARASGGMAPRRYSPWRPRVATFSFTLDRAKLRQCSGAKAAICCAPISAAKTRPSCGGSTSNSSRSRPPSRPEGRSAAGPIHHQLEHRIEAHIFVAFLAYCLHITLRARLKPLAPGLTPRAVLDKFAAIQMLDVRFPTTDGRTLILSRYTELTADQKLLARHLKLDLPPQPPPRITAPEKIARLPANAV
jgi:hypothetical protein